MTITSNARGSSSAANTTAARQPITESTSPGWTAGRRTHSLRISSATTCIASPSTASRARARKQPTKRMQPYRKTRFHNGHRAVGNRRRGHPEPADRILYELRRPERGYHLYETNGPHPGQNPDMEGTPAEQHIRLQHILRRGG